MIYVINFCSDPEGINIAKLLRSEGLSNTARYWINKSSIYTAIIEIILGLEIERSEWLRKHSKKNRLLILEATIWKLQGGNLAGFAQAKGISLRTAHNRCDKYSMSRMRECLSLLGNFYFYVAEHSRKCYGDEILS